jgi:hypothetical protein
MTPKEKAIELFNKFKEYSYTDWNGGEDEMTTEQAAKECAIISVDEILDVLGGIGVYSFADTKVTTYWETVKAEIEGMVV